MVAKTSEQLYKEFGTWCDKHAKCLTCRFLEQTLFSHECTGPELPLGEMTYLESRCEQHQFRDLNLDKEMHFQLDSFWHQWLVENPGYVPLGQRGTTEAVNAAQ